MSPLYKPQFAYPVPDGYTDEDFIIPFSFTIPGTGQLQRGLPLQLDDDNPSILRGIYFSVIGQNTRGGAGATNPGRVRIYDTLGNPLSDGPILALGMWGSGGIDTVGTYYSWGFPIEPEVLCAPGGVITFDFQMQTTAGIASIQVQGAAASMTAYAGVTGTTGNGRTIQLIDPGAPNIALSVAAVGNNAQVTLATDGASAITSTYLDVVNAMNASAALVGIMAASFDDGSDPTEVATASGPTAVFGAIASTPVTISGSFYGAKRLRAC